VLDLEVGPVKGVKPRGLGGNARYKKKG
jgi:hypothetical protein